MRKRIVVSMLVIALAAALLGGAAFAWFTDSESAAATFTAGTLDLTIQPAETLVTIENMAPGDVAAETLTITNSGSLEMFYRLSFVKDETCTGTLDEVLHVYIDDVDNGTLADLGGKFIFDSTMRLASGASKDFSIKFELPGAATGNAYQNQTYTGTIVVQAVQTKNNEGVDSLPLTWE